MTGRRVAPRPAGRRVRPGRLRAALVGFRRSPILVAGVILTAAAAGSGFGGYWHLDSPASALEAVGTSSPAPVSLEAQQPSAASDPAATITAGTGVAGSPQDPVPLSGGAPAPGVVPLRLTIPSIGVDAALVDLMRDDTGVLLPPDGLQDAGWYSGSSVPGSVGPAVLAGHVDDTETAGVFSRLRELQPGAEIVVALSDGSTRTFLADHATDVAKADFPSDDVYGPTRTPELRLITCNGPYDYDVMHYSNNYIVYATAAG